MIIRSAFFVIVGVGLYRKTPAVPFILVLLIGSISLLQERGDLQGSEFLSSSTLIGELNFPEVDWYSGFEKVDDYPLYVMAYEGDYGFTEYLRTGELDASFTDGSHPSCTCFAACGGEPVFGRNFDFPRNPALLLFTDPPDGFASVSMVDLGYFGYGVGDLPDPEEGIEPLRDSPYLPFDGMNERGLVVSMAAVPRADAPVDPGKVTLGEIQVIRLLLDRAGSVDEALGLLGQFNVRMTEPPIHYLIADRSGSSAIVEFVDGEMVVLRDDEPWQVITNFIVVGSGAPGDVPCSRYRCAYGGLSEAGGHVSMDEAMFLLAGSSQSSTIWSTVYNMETGEICIAMGRDFDHLLRFQAPTSAGG